MYNSRMPVVYETETPLAPRGDLGPYRQADYLALPDEPRCELLYGRLLVMPAPTVRHQRVVTRMLYRVLLDFADRDGDRGARLAGRRQPGRPLDRAARRDLCLEGAVRRSSARASRELRISSSRFSRPVRRARPRREAPALRRLRRSPSTGSSIPVLETFEFLENGATAFACAFPKAGRLPLRGHRQASSSTSRRSGARSRVDRSALSATGSAPRPAAAAAR